MRSVCVCVCVCMYVCVYACVCVCVCGIHIYLLNALILAHTRTHTQTQHTHTHTYIQDDPHIMEQSPFRTYLHALVDALVREEIEQLKEYKYEYTGPCMEFFLRQGVIDKMCAYGIPDVCV